jgi:uncharacterized protein (DUF1015 family)
MTSVSGGSGLLFAPFRGVRYADPESLARRLAPPYDVLSAAERNALAAQDHANIVHVDLPIAPRGGDAYREAAALLRAWQGSSILTRETEPAAYVLRTTSTFEDGRTRSRTGVFLAVAAMPFAPGGRIRPHEKTHGAAKEDRRRLMLATGANTSSIFLLAPDSRGDLARTMDGITKHEPWAAVEAIGAKQEIWIVQGQMAMRLSLLASDEQAYIADGHHRYETAVQVREQAPSPWKAGAQRTLAHVVSCRDPGLEILPTHRLIEGRPLERAAVLKAASPFFGRPVAGQVPTLTAVFADGTEAPMVLRPDANLAAAVDLSPHPAVRSLAVAVADAVFIRMVVGSVTGAAPAMRYTPVESEAREAAQSGAVALTVLLPPPTLDEVRAVSDAGQFMPPKSTFFAPKVPTGVVVRLFEGER